MYVYLYEIIQGEIFIVTHSYYYYHLLCSLYLGTFHPGRQSEREQWRRRRTPFSSLGYSLTHSAINSCYTSHTKKRRIAENSEVKVRKKIHFRLLHLSGDNVGLVPWWWWWGNEQNACNIIFVLPKPNRTIKDKNFSELGCLCVPLVLSFWLPPLCCDDDDGNGERRLSCNVSKKTRLALCIRYKRW